MNLKQVLMSSTTLLFLSGCVAFGSNQDTESSSTTYSEYEETESSEEKVTERVLLPSAKIVRETPAPAPKIESFTLAAHDNFATDSAQLSPNGKALLSEAISNLAKASVTSIRIVGHTDWVGTDEYNMDLSLRRAQAVRNYLESNGVPPSMIETSGKGESQPIASNQTPEGRAQNRRVQITFTIG